MIDNLDQDSGYAITTKETHNTALYPTFECSASLNEFYAAMAKCQGEMGPLIKDNEVSMELRNGQKKKYNYADLGQAYETIKEIAPKHGICFFQDIQSIDEEFFILTEVGHSSGQYRRSRVKIIIPEFTNYDKQPRRYTSQEFGSAVTYQRRYAILGSFGIASQDDDGAEASKAASRPQAAPSKSPFEKKIESTTDKIGAAPATLKNYAPGASHDPKSFISFEAANELKMLGLKNSWTVDNMSECIKAMSGAVKWGEIKNSYYENLKFEFGKKI